MAVTKLKELENMSLEEIAAEVKQGIKELEPEQLSEYDARLAQAKSQGEVSKIVLEVLRKKGYNIETIIEKFVDLAENAITSDPKGNIIPNDYVKLQALTKLAEMAGLYKSKNIQIKTNFLQVLYSGEDE